MTPVLSDREWRTVGEMLEGLVRPVTWHLYFGAEDDAARIGRQLAEGLRAKAPPGLVGVAVNGPSPPDLAGRPAWLLRDRDGRETGVRFYGLPAGYQFAVLIDAMLDVSRARIMVEPKTYYWCQRLAEVVTLTVMVMPTCPHSPRVVRLTQRLARANPGRIRAQAVDASMFRTWAEAVALSEVPLMVAEAEGLPPYRAVGGLGERELVARLEAWLHGTRETAGDHGEGSI